MELDNVRMNENVTLEIGRVKVFDIINNKSYLIIIYF